MQRKIIPYILILIALLGIFSLVTRANAQTEPLGTCTYTDSFGNPQNIWNVKKSDCTGAKTWSSNGYQLLAPLPCENTSPGCVNGKLINFNTAQPNNLGVYLNMMITIFIGVCAVLSVVMIVIGGIEVMTSELAHTKQAGKERIENALLGLLIALGAYALLFTINPDLLNSDINAPKVTAPAVAPTVAVCTPPQVQEGGTCVPVGTCQWYNQVGEKTSETQALCDERKASNPPDAPAVYYDTSKGLCYWSNNILETTRNITKSLCMEKVPPENEALPTWTAESNRAGS